LFAGIPMIGLPIFIAPSYPFHLAPARRRLFTFQENKLFLHNGRVV
jgi:hypothetical protein